MQARNKHTGAAIVGTLELIQGRADIDADSFTFGPDGALMPDGFEHAGYTEVFWEDQRTAENEKGQIIFLDDKGNECTADDIEPMPDEDDDAPVTSHAEERNHA